MQTRGEKLSEQELARLLPSLLGTGDVAAALKGVFDADRFAKEVLGFM